MRRLLTIAGIACTLMACTPGTNPFDLTPAPRGVGSAAQSVNPDTDGCDPPFTLREDLGFCLATP